MTKRRAMQGFLAWLPLIGLAGAALIAWGQHQAQVQAMQKQLDALDHRLEYVEEHYDRSED